MKPLYGNELVNELREKANVVKKRLWIIVPYIGTMNAVLKILGKEWLENSAIDFKLLTDISDLSAINTETVKQFYERGNVKTLTGLHAKIYIIDDTALITSANLTGTAFSKRHEIGVFTEEVTEIIRVFEEWWNKAEIINLDDLQRIKQTKNKGDGDEPKLPLKTIWKLPKSPSTLVKKRHQYVKYERLLLDFKDFAKKYQKVQRLWSDEPIFMEIDGLFNFLFHEDISPSREYKDAKPRSLTENEQEVEIKKWAKKYRKWNKQQSEEDIEWRKNNTIVVQDLLSKENIDKLNFDKLEDVLSSLNSMNSYAINKVRVLNPSNNSIENIRNAFKILIHGTAPVGARIKECESEIKYFGKSSANELIGCFYPKKFPLINQNSISGLRFFGYQSKM
jgi:hypothetical protein